MIHETVLPVAQYQSECLALHKASGITTNPVALGLIEEIGELCGKFKKVVRDHGGEITPAWRDAMVKEAGDVLWHVAMLGWERDQLSLAVVTGGIMFVVLDYPGTAAIDIDPMKELHLLAFTAAQITTGYLPIERVTLHRVLNHLAKFCSWFGVTMEHVAKVNLAKLRDRGARGVVRGQGDDR